MIDWLCHDCLAKNPEAEPTADVALVERPCRDCGRWFPPDRIQAIRYRRTKAKEPDPHD